MHTKFDLKKGFSTRRAVLLSLLLLAQLAIRLTIAWLSNIIQWQ